MTKQEIIQIINAGFTPANFFKRGAWTKIERVMNYLANVGLIIRTPNSEVKFATIDGCSLSEDEINVMANRYMHSPFTEHLNEYAQLSAETGLPMNSGKLLKIFMDHKI